MDTTLLRKLDTLAEIVSFGLDFIDGGELNTLFVDGQLECLANQISSALAQWVVDDSVGTSDIMEYFGFDEEKNWGRDGRPLLTRGKIHELLINWIKEFAP